MKRVLAIIIGVSILMLSATSAFAQMTAKDHFNRGNDYYEQGDYEKALASYKEAIRIKPDFAEAHYELGRIFDKTEDGENAKFYMKKAKELFIEQDKPISSAFDLLLDYRLKYGRDPFLPVDYSESDRNSREIWFEFKPETFNPFDPFFWGKPAPMLNCSNLLDYQAKFIFMRSGRFLYQVNVNGISHEFLGLEVNPKNALVDYSGVNGFSFSERLTFELKQHVRNIIIKFSGEVKKVKRCEI